MDNLKTVQQLKTDKDVLFAIANNYAGDPYGYIAVRLHQICNYLSCEIDNTKRKDSEIVK